MSDQYRTDVQKSNFEGKYDASSVMVTVSGGVAIFSCLEMILLILTTFKKWRGLYFWSMWLCNLGILMYAFGFMMVYFQLSALWFAKVLNDLGWIGLVVCQSLVLYSRLGLIVFDTRILKAVKWMIIVDSVVLVPFPIIFDFGNTFTDLSIFPKGFFYIEHVQITVFSLQECIISTIYVIRTVALLKVITKANTRGVIWQLLVINMIIIPMDVTLIVCQFKKLQLYQEGIKVFVYAVKLKLELNILSKLVDFIRENDKQRTMTIDVIDSDSLAGQGQVNIRQEESTWKALRSVDTNDERELIDINKIKDTQAIPHRRPSAAPNPPTENTMENAFSRPSIGSNASAELSLQRTATSQRLKGRESDAMYADVLRSL